MYPQFEIQIIAILTALACSLPGVFLVLRKSAMISDAISHSILLGIVLAFFVVHNLGSPLLIIGAAVVGVFTVFLTELLNKSRLIKEDASIGLVFPLLFSIGILLISKFARDVHLDIDTVLLGEIAFAPFYRLELWGIDFGSVSMIVLLLVLIINIIFIILFYKELKISTFDKGLALALGFSPALIHYSLMTVVSFTAVASFEAVGSILVVAFMIVPASSAYLISNRLSSMLLYTSVFAIISAETGYYFAKFTDTSIAGSMAVVSGIIFLGVFLFAPKKGYVIKLFLRKKQKEEFLQKMVLIHLNNHLNTKKELENNSSDIIYRKLNWEKAKTIKVINSLINNKLAKKIEKLIVITEKGKNKIKNQFE